MKEKHKILLELEEQKELRQELTAELQALTTELEKERSKSTSASATGGKNKADKGKVGLTKNIFHDIIYNFSTDFVWISEGQVTRPRIAKNKLL